jgi:ABC-2 type transport system permease protein
MKLGRVLRWELRRTLQSKQFLLMTILIPAIVAMAVFAYTMAAGTEPGSSGTFTEPPPPAVIAVFLAVILFMGAFLSGVMTLYSVVKEKQSRVVEMVLSSVSAWEMMAGKILGLGIAGLVQVTIWAATAYFVAGRFLPLSLASLSLVHWITFPLYFILGFLLIASLYAAVGSVMRDIQSGGASGLVGIVPYVPILFAAFIIQNPGNLVVRIAGFLPPFAPSVMMLRIAATPMVSEGARSVPSWEIAVSLLSLALGVFLTMRFAARVFEVGMLMYGKSATLRELWRWGRTRRS